jgi:uncharacterized protein YecE (DUF72 family)
MQLHIGCSGFHYNDWRGTFYPEKLAKTKWFEFYAEHFSTLELNVTFYRFPQLSVLQGWHKRSPADFRFAVKTWRGITHYKKFNDTADFITRFYDTINNGLQEKLGPVLFQLPPSYDYTEERLERIINSLDSSFINVFEPRHVTWWREDVYRELGKHNIAFCGMSHPKLPDDVIENASNIYYRFHGVPQLYRSSYSTEFLQKVVDSVKCNSKAQAGWFYFNNDYDAVGVENAKRMIGFI